jgi:23S rRNA (adenine2503-C2)-methyltransferase
VKLKVGNILLKYNELGSARSGQLPDLGLRVIDPTRKQNLLDLDQRELKAFFVRRGEKAFRASQVMKWIHHYGVSDFHAMTDLSNRLRADLCESAEIRAPEVARTQRSIDGTRKWLLRVGGGNSVETVYIPEEGRGTLCVSSQVGCALDCSFCATAREGFNRNLTTAEIIGQVWRAHQLMEDFSPGSGRSISNIVFMGMGEPLLNFKNLVRALDLLLDDLGYGLSKRRVTVSTAGLVPAIDQLRDRIDVSLAVSLHAPDDDLRNELVPINRKYPIADLLEGCRRFARGDRKKSITFEYVMLDGVNDQPEQARALTKLLQGIPAKVNLIPFNAFESCGYRRSSDTTIDRFRALLSKGGLRTITRKPRGQDIDAACGQLAGQVVDLSRRYKKFGAARYGEGY